jgi:hypothetical protein
MNAKVKAPRCCLPLPPKAGNSSLGVNTPSSSGNVYFANGQTVRTDAMYARKRVLLCYLMIACCWVFACYFADVNVLYVIDYV